jgi:AAA family ATPase
LCLQLGHPDYSVHKCIRDTSHPLGYQESSLSLSFSTMSLDDAPSENRNDTKNSKSYDEKDLKNCC